MVAHPFDRRRSDLLTRTDANGQYAFSNVPDGDYTVNEVDRRDWVQTFPRRPARTRSRSPATYTPVSISATSVRRSNLAAEVIATRTAIRPKTQTEAGMRAGPFIWTPIDDGTLDEATVVVHPPVESLDVPKTSWI